MTEIKLDYPIKIEGVEVKALKIRRVKVSDLETMNRETGELAKSICLLSALTEVSPDDIRNMDAADFNKASLVVADFLE